MSTRRVPSAAFPWLAAAALAVLAAPVRADQEAGIVLTRRAQAALAAGDGERALELLREARVEWPGSPVVANTIADAQRELGRYAEALAEYERGMRDEYAHHALFNRAVTRDRMAEAGLAEAGVPADVGALPEGPQPDMLEAIERALPELVAATDDFLDSLDREPVAAARESVAALNRRVDALRAMQEELQKRQEEQEEEEDQEDQEDQQDEQDEQEQDDQQEQEDSQDQDDEQDQQDQQDEQEPQDDASQDSQPQDEAQATPRELSPEEVQQLLDRLDELEKEARAIQKRREAAERQAVEKDW